MGTPSLKAARLSGPSSLLTAQEPSRGSLGIVKKYVVATPSQLLFLASPPKALGPWDSPDRQLLHKPLQVLSVVT
jgi:hypothetical protein